MGFWVVVGFFGALAVTPILVRALRSRWGSPELRVTLNAVAIAIVLDMLPLIFVLIRGQRSSNKK